ncbi:LCP family protein [Leptolyngbya sp. AN02str]|uniref:LCP family protein n=1 Tax=Leptolyngbya sp. AN02str TaxID=3423363 RepID=UPI003D31A2E8
MPLWRRRWVLGLAFAVTAGVSATLGLALTMLMPSPAAKELAPQSNKRAIASMISNTLGYRITRPVNILVMGIDLVPGAEENSSQVFNGRTDTMLLVHIDPVRESASILSIPRDTQVSVPGVGYTKVNHANSEGGPGLAARTITENLDGVTVDRYIRVSTQAFRELVDLLGGVEVNVPFRMRYTDNTQKLNIDLQPGVQILSGAQAEQFARFRSDAYGDVGRVQRQQQLLSALKERVATPAVVPKIPQAIQILQRYIDTNLSADEMLALVDFGLSLNRESFRMVMLPGRFSTPQESRVSYWIMDPEGRDRVLRDYFSLNTTVLATEPRTFNELRIAIQNATDEPHLSREVARYLRSQGFENVYVVQDWDNVEAETQIIVQRGDLRGAETLESIVGVGQVVPASTGILDSDLTLRVGNDWFNRVDDRVNEL